MQLLLAHPPTRPPTHLQQPHQPPDALPPLLRQRGRRVPRLPLPRDHAAHHHCQPRALRSPRGGGSCGAPDHIARLVLCRQGAGRGRAGQAARS